MPLSARRYPSAWTGRPWEVQVGNLRRGMKGLVGSDGCSLGPATGLARPGPSLPARDFTFHVPTGVCYGYRGLSRVQVSADYSSGSCESDFVVVVTSNRQRSRFLPEQNRSLCAVKFLITVLNSHKLLLIRYHYCT